MNIIKVGPEILFAELEDFFGCKEQMRQTMQGIDQIIGELEGIWDDEDADEFAEEYGVVVTLIENAYKRIDEYVDYVFGQSSVGRDEWKKETVIDYSNSLAGDEII